MNGTLALGLVIAIAVLVWAVNIFWFIRASKRPSITPIIKGIKKPLPEKESKKPNKNNGYDKPEPEGISIFKIANLNQKPNKESHADNKGNP